jgi:hypothetical protein
MEESGLRHYCPGIRLEELSKTTKNLSQDSRSPGQHLKTRTQEYEAGMLTTRPRRSIGCLFYFIQDRNNKCLKSYVI